MRLTESQSRALLAKHGVYVTEVCDTCGKILGHVRFTRYGKPGEWCSRHCRDGVNVREPGKCRHCRAKLPEGKRRGAAFCDDGCRKAYGRERGTVKTAKLSRTKPSIYAAFCTGKRAG